MLYVTYTHTRHTPHVEEHAHASTHTHTHTHASSQVPFLRVYRTTSFFVVVVMCVLTYCSVGELAEVGHQLSVVAAPTLTLWSFVSLVWSLLAPGCFTLSRSSTLSLSLSLSLLVVIRQQTNPQSIMRQLSFSFSLYIDDILPRLPVFRFGLYIS